MCFTLIWFVIYNCSQHPVIIYLLCTVRFVNTACYHVLSTLYVNILIICFTENPQCEDISIKTEVRKSLISIIDQYQICCKYNAYMLFFCRYTMHVHSDLVSFYYTSDSDCYFAVLVVVYNYLAISI